MKSLLLSMLFCCGLIIYDSSAVQHNLFYGNCSRTAHELVPIYTQVITMNNPHAIHMPSRPVRRWYNWLSNISFRRRPTTTSTPPPPIVSGKVINASVIYPVPGMENSQTIECIQVIDNVQNGYGAFASIVGGGFHQNKTEIRLISQPGGIIHSTITIFTHKKSSPSPPPPAQTPFGWKLNSNPIVHPNQIPGYKYPSNQHQAHKSYYPWNALHQKK
ncbi:uncharacterized protein LOC116352032 [Contarinia nasturtii]|uniref:uncharacterized protein LOC116352032 n=1 Tax=Contarinia nasturtii TaxID=265458 RepID=UPI0012D42C36|nr:uncharacterized protein LOC116352032 [Contarinia nasturtii]